MCRLPKICRVSAETQWPSKNSTPPNPSFLVRFSSQQSLEQRTSLLGELIFLGEVRAFRVQQHDGYLRPPFIPGVCLCESSAPQHPGGPFTGHGGVTCPFEGEGRLQLRRFHMAQEYNQSLCALSVSTGVCVGSPGCGGLGSYSRWRSGRIMSAGMRSGSGVCAQRRPSPA